MQPPVRCEILESFPDSALVSLPARFVHQDAQVLPCPRHANIEKRFHSFSTELIDIRKNYRWRFQTLVGVNRRVGNGFSLLVSGSQGMKTCTPIQMQQL